MGRIEVEYGQLGDVAAGLQAFQDDSGRAHASLGEVDREAAGHASLAKAVADFREKWDFSLQKIAENAHSMGQRLGVAATSYQGVDDQIADAASGKGEAADGTEPAVGATDPGLEWRAPAFGA